MLFSDELHDMLLIFVVQPLVIGLFVLGIKIYDKARDWIEAKRNHEHGNDAS
jgi:hypothetical protein